MAGGRNAGIISPMRAGIAALALALASPAYAAGNVSVSSDAGRVMVEGDGAPNAIVVTAGAEPDAILIAGLDGTTVNGLPELTVAGVQRLVVHTGDAADRVELRQVRMQGRVQLKLGRGDDVVVAEQVTVHRLDVRTGAGNDAITVGPQSRVQGLLHIRTGKDRDAVSLESSNLSAIIVGTGPGDDVVSVFDARVAGRTRVFTKAGEDVAFFGLTRFVGDVDLNLGDDDDVLRLDTVVFDDDSNLDGGEDDDVLFFDGPVDFDDSPRIDFEFAG